MDADQPLAPSVVCVVVVHDPGPWFDETLAAFAAQDYPDLRHLFLVTGRPDDERFDVLSEQIRDRLPGAFVRAIGGNPGFGTAANEVLRLVEGDNGFFLLCHDDVAPDPNAVRTLVTELYRSNAGIVGPKLVEWDDPRKLQHVGLDLDRFGEIDPIVEPGEHDQEQHDAVRDVFVLPSACVLIRADLFRTLGGYDPAIDFHGDDAELCWRAHLTGARVIVAPDARVRHREQLELRRADLNHRQLAARHRMRTVATLTGASRLPVRSIQLVVLTAIELVVGLFTGRLGEALSSTRALIGLLPRTPSVVARRRQIRAQRRVPEAEVLGLQTRGSARLQWYLRGRETTTYARAGTTVLRWRERSFGPLLAWFLLIVAVVIGSRTFIDRGVPPVGEFLPFPESARELFDRYLTGFDARGFGATSPAPTGWLALVTMSALVLFRSSLVLVGSILGLTLVGAAGVWRLATVFPSNRARIAAVVVYVGTPLVPGMLGTGRWSALLWFATLPWAVHLLRRACGIETADPTAYDDDLTDGTAPIDVRSRIRLAAGVTLLVGVTVAVVPVALALWPIVGAALAVGTLVAGGSPAIAGWAMAVTAASTAVGALLNLPWLTAWTSEAVWGAPLAGPRGEGLLTIATFAIDDRAFTVLAVALYLPLLAAVAVAQAWRLTWAARGAALVVTFGAIAVLADRGRTPFAAIDPALLLVPVALGLALGAAALAGGFADDVLSRGFGWRQPIAVLATAAIVLGVVPAVISIGDGAWGAPRTTTSTLLAQQLPADAVEGDYRVLFLGDPRVLPAPAVEYRDGVAYAVVDDGALDLTDIWAVPATTGDDATVAALDRIAESSTLRAGRLLAPLGIRFVVVPLFDGSASTVDDPIPPPTGLVEAFADQLDIGEIFPSPNVRVFENRAWLPLSAQLVGATAAASAESTPESLVRADLSGTTAAFPGVLDDRAASGQIESGVVHLGVPFTDDWTLEGDAVGPPRLGFGVTTAFDVGAAGPATLGYDEPTSRTIWVIAQLLMWLIVAGAATRATTRLGGRARVDTDETLIEFDESVPMPAQVAGEALGVAGWPEPATGELWEWDDDPTADVGSPDDLAGREPS